MRVVKDLHDVGFTRVVMMTGDSRKTAAAVANRLGMDEFYAEVLPEDKAAFIRREHDAGRKVVMIGDGGRRDRCRRSYRERDRRYNDLCG